MTHAAALPYALPAPLVDWLHEFHAALCAVDAARLAQALAMRPGPALDTPEALVGALCIGGADLAEQLVSLARPGIPDDDRTARVADALADLLDQAAGLGTDGSFHLGVALAETLRLDRPGADLLDQLRNTFLVDRGDSADLGLLIQQALDRRDWPLALRGLERARQALGADTPRSIYGHGAFCLHHLGRYAEAEAWAAAGLGDDAVWLALPPIASQADLLARWGGRSEPVVSIICTTYNHERYIESAIRGFLAQDCDFPFEVLIHDDASTDQTQAVIRRWQAQYPQIIKPVLQTENQYSRGGRPFEILLAHARGEFVATCEGDDYWIAANKLGRQVAFLRQHPEMVCTAHNYLHYTELTLTVKAWGGSGRNSQISEHQLMGVHRLLWLPTLMFRRRFSTLPPERALAAFGDQFLVAYLGTLGRGAHFDTYIGAVRRENEFSDWSPLPPAEKERRRVQTWAAICRMHRRLGSPAAVIAELDARIDASPLEAAIKAATLARVQSCLLPGLAAPLSTPLPATVN